MYYLTIVEVKFTTENSNNLQHIVNVLLWAIIIGG